VLVPLRMTIAAVKAAAVTSKICFFMAGPHVVSEFTIFILHPKDGADSDAHH
jgi:hypothetical protein